MSNHNHPNDAVRLVEYSRSDADLSSRVDAAAGVIRGVKIVGLESRNAGRAITNDRAKFGSAMDRSYAYAPEALRRAIPLYEAAPVCVDHPTFSYDRGVRTPASERRTSDKFGRFRNVRLTETGLVGDLEYLKTHPLAAMVVESAQRMPELLAFSHNAYGRPVTRDGRIVIDEIYEVRSIDLVGEQPGTTSSLFESEAQMPEAQQQQTPPVTPPAATPPATPPAVPPAPPAAPLTESVNLQAMRDELASTKQKLAKAEAREHARTLLETAGVKQEPAWVDAVSLMETDDQRKKFIETLPKPKPSARSGAPLLESRQDADTQVPDIKDSKSFAAYLLD